MDDSEANVDPFTDAGTFASDTAISPLGEDRWGATLRRGWWIVRGPNGGYLAAIVLRAILAEVDDPARRPRSVTLHYIAPPQAGPAEVHTTIERSGRSLTTVTARLIQAGEVKVLAMAAVATDRDAPEWSDLPAPDVPPADVVAASEEPSGVPLSARFDQRGLQGRPFAGEPRAQTMGCRWPTPRPVPAAGGLHAARSGRRLRLARQATRGVRKSPRRGLTAPVTSGTVARTPIVFVQSERFTSQSIEGVLEIVLTEIGHEERSPPV